MDSEWLVAFVFCAVLLVAGIGFGIGSAFPATPSPVKRAGHRVKILRLQVEAAELRKKLRTLEPVQWATSCVDCEDK
jgi:hypothetical protein